MKNATQPTKFCTRYRIKTWYCRGTWYLTNSRFSQIENSRVSEFTQVITLLDLGYLPVCD